MARNKIITFIPVASLIFAFIFSLFFTGYTNVLYAPALLLLIAAGLVTALPALWRGQVWPLSAPVLGFGAFWLYVTASLIWTSIPFTSLVTWLIFSAAPLIFFALILSRSVTPVYLCAGGLTLALAGVALWAFIGENGVGGRAVAAGLPNPNTLAALMNLGLLPSLALAMTRKERDLFFYLSTALAALFFAALLASESRGGLCSAFISIGVLFAVLRAHLTRKKLGLLALGGGLIFVIAQLGGSESGARLLAALTHPAQESEISTRLALWQAAFSMIKDHPWSGTGLGTFFQYYPSYEQPDVDNSAGQWAHNDPLQYAAEMGLAAPFLFYLFLSSVLWRTIKRYSKISAEHRPLTIGLFCGLLAVALHSHATFNFYILAVLIVCGVWLALWYLLTETETEEPRARPRFILITASLVFSALFTLMTVSSAVGTYYVTQARDAIQRGQIGAFQTALNNARRFGPATMVDPEIMLAGFYLDLLENPVLWSFDEQSAMQEETADLLDHAALLNPAWAEITHKRALLALIEDDKDTALTLWRQALEQNPRHEKARKELAALYVMNGMPQSAYNVLADGLRYPRSRALDAELKKLMKDVAPIAEIQRRYVP